MPDSKFNRRRFIQAGLGAGAGFALWELYRLTISNRIDRGAASLQAFNEFGLDRDQLRKLLDIALAEGGDYADIFLENSLSSYMSFDGEQFQNSGLESVSGAAIRVIARGRSSLRAISDLSWEGLTQAARDAGAAARGGRQAPPTALQSLPIPNLYPGDAPALFESISEKQEILRRVNESARNAYQYVQSAHASYRDTLRFLTVATSDGVFAHDAQPLLKIIISVTAVNPDNLKTGTGLFSGGGHYGLEYFKEHSPERLGRREQRLHVISSRQSTRLRDN